MTTMTTSPTYKFRCPAVSGVLDLDASSPDSIVALLVGQGLVLDHSGISFPAYLLNSVTWVVAWKHEIIDGEDRRWLSDGEKNEMRNLKRLLDKLKALGGRDELEFNEDGWKEGCGPQVTEDAPVEEPAAESASDEMVTFSLSSTAWAVGIGDKIARAGGKYEFVKVFGFEGRKVQVRLDETARDVVYKIACDWMASAQDFKERGVWRRLRDNVARTDEVSFDDAVVVAGEIQTTNDFLKTAGKVLKGLL